MEDNFIELPREEFFDLPIKPGTTVWNKISGKGIYLYPHNVPVQPDSLCSVYSIDLKKVFQITVEDLKGYKNKCWNCGVAVNSISNNTCPVCHWVICPQCGKCSVHRKDNDIIVIDNKEDFMARKYNIGDAFDTRLLYFGKFEINEVEKYIEKLIKNNIQIFISPCDIGWADLFIYKEDKVRADNLLSLSDITLDDLFSCLDNLPPIDI